MANTAMKSAAQIAKPIASSGQTSASDAPLTAISKSGARK